MGGCQALILKLILDVDDCSHFVGLTNRQIESESLTISAPSKPDPASHGDTLVVGEGISRITWQHQVQGTEYSDRHHAGTPAQVA